MLGQLTPGAKADYPLSVLWWALLFTYLSRLRWAWSEVPRRLTTLTTWVPVLGGKHPVMKSRLSGLLSRLPTRLIACRLCGCRLPRLCSMALQKWKSLLVTVCGRPGVVRCSRP